VVVSNVDGDVRFAGFASRHLW